MSRAVLCGLSALLASAAAAPLAWAQGAPPSGAGQEVVGQLEEVIVTAQRRAESLQEAAISVDAISAEELVSAGVGSSAGDLNRLVPAAQIATNGSPYPSFYIRGVGNFNVNPYTDSTVGFNYDGVPITRAAAAAGVFYDISRIEVLKGPQGTLYGRNNTGGAINVLPNRPVLNEYQGGATVTVGNYNLVQGTGYVNVPMGDRAAFRVAANYIDRDGYYNNGASDDEGQSARAQLFAQATPALDVNLAFDYHHQGGKGLGLTLLNTPRLVSANPLQRYGVSDGQPYGGDAWRDINTTCDGRADGAAPLDLDDYLLLACDSDAYTDSTFTGFTGTINWALPWATLTVVPAMRFADMEVLSRGGAPDTLDQQDSTTKSLEVRLASDPEDKLYWLVGAFLLDDKLDATYTVRLSFINSAQVLTQETKSQAAFASVRYSLTDAFRAQAGIRYTRDERSFQGVTSTNNLSVDAKKEWNEATYRLGVEYDVAPDSMLFATYETGYKAGGFFFASPQFGQSFDPEYVTAYSIGSRNLFFDRRLLLNVDVFRYLYRDQQVSQFDFDPFFGPTGSTVFPTRNFGAINYTGIEVETQFFVTPTTLLHADMQYLDSEFKTPPYISDPNVASRAVAARGRAPNSPEFTATFGIQQTFDLGSQGKIVADLDGQYRSEVLLGTGFAPWEYADAVTTGDFSVRYEAANSAWSVTGFVNNFTDEDVPIFIGGSGAMGFLGPVGPTVVAIPPQPVRAAYRAPRTYGVRVSASF